jgi:hypothetical protein
MGNQLRKPGRIGVSGIRYRRPTRRPQPKPEEDPDSEEDLLVRRREPSVSSERLPSVAVVVRFPLPPLLVKGDELDRVPRISVPRVPTAPLARVAVLGGFGNLRAAMDRLIAPIRELPPNQPPCSLTCSRSMWWGSGNRDPPEELRQAVPVYGQRERPRCARQRPLLCGGPDYAGVGTGDLGPERAAPVVEPERQGVRSCVKRRRASRSLERPGDHRRSGARACSEATRSETTKPSVAERTTSRPSGGEPPMVHLKAVQSSWGSLYRNFILAFARNKSLLSCRLRSQPRRMSQNGRHLAE